MPWSEGSCRKEAPCLFPIYHRIVKHLKEIAPGHESQTRLPSVPKEKGSVPPVLSQKEALSLSDIEILRVSLRTMDRFMACRVRIPKAQ